LGFLPLLILILIIRANYLVHSPNDPAAVYLLYETTDYIQLTKDKNLIYPVPEWGVATMFYTISETAINRWGPGSVSLEPLSKANLSKAFREGRLVIVSAHGSYEGISISEYTNEFYGPEDVGKHGGVGSNLQFVYFNGCNIGKREEAWKKSLGDVEPVVYDYIAFEQKHVLWYVFKGPIIVLNLK
jgi:hypothetical protein